MNVLVSIITINFNSTLLLVGLLESIKKSHLKFPYEIIVIDNGSTEDVSFLSKRSDIKFIQSQNLGFSHGNNLGVKHSVGEYVWFLNPDTTVETNTISYMLDYIQSHPDVGIATPKLTLPDGSLDKNCHRAFPTIWNSFCHFIGLDQLFPKSKLFSSYYLGYLPTDQPTEVDVVGGSSVLMPRWVGDKVGWWDADYFMYGEDIDLAYKVKQLGLKVMFVPQVAIHHYHGASSGLKKTSATVTTADSATRLRSALATTRSMRIFYKKHLALKHNPLINFLVYLGITLLESLRKLQVRFS